MESDNHSAKYSGGPDAARSIHWFALTVDGRMPENALRLSIYPLSMIHFVCSTNKSFATHVAPTIVESHIYHVVVYSMLAMQPYLALMISEYAEAMFSKHEDDCFASVAFPKFYRCPCKL